MGRIKKFLVCLSTITLLGGVMAQSQPSDAPPRDDNGDVEKEGSPEKLKRVTITGSNIKRINAETASPVQIITREEMARSGATSLNEVLRQATSNVGGVSDSRTNGFSAGAAGLDLRGIGSNATLLLINGRRVSPYAQPEFTSTFGDLNSIPFGAVDRVEILKDGASAIYGSEAIAGVVNVILRDSYEGKGVSVSAGGAQAGDGTNKHASVMYGVGSLVDDLFNAYVNLDIRQKKPEYMKNRPEYIGTTDWRPWGYKDARSTYGFPGNLYWRDAKLIGTAKPLADCPKDRQSPATSVYGPKSNAVGIFCLFDSLKDGDFNSGGNSDRIGLTAHASWQLNPDTLVYTDLMRNENKAKVTGSANFFAGNGLDMPALPITHPQYPRELIGPDGKTLAGGSGLVRVASTLNDFPGIGQDNTTVFDRYLIGTKFSLGNFDFDTALLRSSSTVDSYATGVLKKDALLDAYLSGTLQFGGPSNAALYDSLRTTAANHFDASVTSWDLKASGELVSLPAGRVASSLGLEYRQESLNIIPDEQSVAGNLYHLAQASPGYKNQRNVTSAFGELAVPIVAGLEAQLALRHDRYSDYGSSTTPKIGMRWNVNPHFLVRGTMAEGFRAPTLVENSTDVRNAYLVVQDPARCNENFSDGCNWQSPYVSGSNPDLKPEKSKSATVGFVWEPSDNFNISVDLWNIVRINEISSLDVNNVLQNPDRYVGSSVARVDRAPLTVADQAAGATAGEITKLTFLYTNVSQTNVKGIDLDLRGKMNFGEYGLFKPRLSVTYTDSYKRAPTQEDSLVEFIGTKDQPKIIGDLGITWEKGPWMVSSNMHYIGGTDMRGDFSVPCTYEAEGYPDLCADIPSFVTFNLGLEYKGFRDWVIRGAIENLFNKLPPFVPDSSSGLGFDPYLTSARGRYFALTAEYTFR